MSYYRKPPIGSPEHNQLSIAPMEGKERRRQKRPDYQPQEKSSLYDRFIRRLDLIQLSGLQDYNFSSKKSRDLISTRSLKVLSPEIEDFLDISNTKSKSVLRMSVYHDDDVGESWISVVNQNRKVKFVFDHEKEEVTAQMQVKTEGGWEEQTTIGNVLEDVDKVLVAVEKLASVNSSGAA